MNVELMERVMTHIESHPAELDMGSFGHRTACGTTYCFAGFTCVLSGWEPVWGHDDVGTWMYDVRDTDGSIKDVELAAQELLQIDRPTAYRIFYGATGYGVEELRDLIDRLIAGVTS